MNIGLYFGSFNPIHTGHLIIANYTVQHTPLEQLWLVVSPQNPFKPSASLLNEYNRLHLVRSAVEGNDKLRASDIEFNLPKPSYTVDTLAYLEEKYPQHSFSIVLGSDSYLNLPKWKNAHVIGQRYPLYVYPRPSFEVIQQQDFPCTIIDAPLLDISSTMIRQWIKGKKDISYLVPEKVKLEISENGYYL
ncbi:MAG: nicotinate (nicotinamide) nucleotide adenylyltransferase [Chitinophagaceae bacterium]